MKKLMSLAIATAFTLSFSACRAGDRGMENQNNRADRGARNIGRTTGFGDNNNVNVNYRDGVYVGYGNEHNGANERATVFIRNGRIVDIDLDRVDRQGGTNIGNAAGVGTDNRGRTGMGAGDGMGMGAGNATNNIGGTGAGTGAGANNATGMGVGERAGIITDSGTGTGTITGVGTDMGIGTRTGINEGPRTGIGGAIGNAAGTAGDALNTARTNLINAMIQNQGDNVNIDNTDREAGTAVGNWRLAVRRALEKARR
jgi:uncharacterized protein with FMN-binding domain